MRKLCLIFVLLALSLHLHATPNTTIIQDVVYRADGSPAHGSLVISWPGFTTAAGYAVAAGQMNLAIGSGGAISLALIPNEGATPAGTFYRVLIKLDDAAANKDILDADKFQEGLGKIIDGVVACLNASAWAKAK